MDVFERRSGWTYSLEVIKKAKTGEFKGFVSALTIPIIYYLMSRHIQEKQARNDVRMMIHGFSTIPLTDEIINRAFKSKLPDFEDAIQFYSAKDADCVKIITRNTKDFEKGEGIAILTPEEFITDSR